MYFHLNFDLKIDDSEWIVSQTKDSSTELIHGLEEPTRDSLLHLAEIANGESDVITPDIGVVRESKTVWIIRFDVDIPMIVSHIKEFINKVDDCRLLASSIRIFLSVSSSKFYDDRTIVNTENLASVAFSIGDQIEYALNNFAQKASLDNWTVKIEERFSLVLNKK